jgi:hypothetical protein
MITILELPTRPDDIVYRGERPLWAPLAVRVCTEETVNDLPPRLDLRCHSPTGFEWGYGGSGPCQLALALLAHALDDDSLALDHYMRFKSEVIAIIAGREWAIRRETIRTLIGFYDRQDFPGRYRVIAA